MSIFEDQQSERSAAVEAILKSSASHKVVVAGPGTGKTYLFKRVCDCASGDVLAITFINNLANDLGKELGGLAECCTFHALCKRLIYQLPVPLISRFVYFPKVDFVINSDRLILGTGIGETREAFEQYLPDDERVKFFLRRAHYYGAVGHTDAVFQVVQFLLDHPELVPAFGQVLVDEYQDFNRLEVKMIEVLARVSPTLIVGDDDQALYDFKHASPEYLRSLAEAGKYKLFALPYCSRCTDAIVTATNQLVTHAAEAGFLVGRIDKPFRCFLPDKDEDNKRFPKLVHAKCSVHKKNTPYVTRFIQSEIEGIVDAGYRPEFKSGVWDFLVVGPGHYLRDLYEVLSRTFPNTFHSSSDGGGLSQADCYAELLRDVDSDIGWRSVLSFYGEELLRPSVQKSEAMDTPFRLLVPKEVVQDVSHTVEILRKLKAGDAINAFEETRLIEVFKQTVERTSVDLGFAAEKVGVEPTGPKHRIRISSFLGCKGLTSNYTFLVGLDNGILPANPQAPTDYEICKFLVGITRARKKCYLISVRNLFGQWQKPSQFINWIDPALLEELYIDKAYLSGKQR